MSTFPTSRPSYQGFTPGDTLKVDNHAAQHNQEQADLGAFSDKVGLGASTPSAGTVLTASGSGTSSWSSVNLTTMVSGVLPVANGGTGISSLGANIAAFLGTPSSANLATALTDETGTGPAVFGTNPTISNPVITNPQISNLTALLGIIYPVGFILSETIGVNPATTFGFGTWAAFAAGQVMVGNGTSDAVYAAGTTGGESTHILTLAEMPSHDHSLPNGVTGGTANNPGSKIGAQYTNGGSGATGSSTGTGSAGSDGAHNNLQPYIVVYFWKRTA